MKTFKKLFAFSAIFALLATLLPTYAFGASYSAELEGAYDYAKGHGITTMDSIENADMYGSLTRVAMAKMMANYSMDVLGLTPDTTMECNFPDVSEPLNAQYDNGVINACQLGLMGVGITNFNPYGLVTRAEFGTVLSRAMYGEENNGGNPYYADHLEALKDAGIMTQISNPMQLEVRGYVMLMMQRASDDSSTSGCTAEELLACITADNYDECIAACSDAEEVVLPGFAEVSRVGSINSQYVPMNVVSKKIGTIKITAGENDTTVSSVVVGHGGLGLISHVKTVQLFQTNGVAATDARPMSNSSQSATVRFAPALVLKAGSSMSFDVMVSLDGGANNHHEFSVKTLNVVNGTTSGAPFDLDNLNTTSYTVGKVTAGLTVGTIVAGKNQETIATIDLSPDANAKVRGFTLTRTAGEDLTKAISNVKAYYNGSVVGTVVMTSEKIVVSDLNLDMLSDETANIEIKADGIYIGRSSNVTFDLNANDVDAIEANTLERMRSNDTDNITELDLDAVDFVVERISTGNVTVAPGTNSVKLLDAKITSDTDFEVSDYTFSFTKNTTGVASLADFTDAKVTVYVNGIDTEVVYADLTHYTTGDSITFKAAADRFLVEAGRVATVKVVANVKSTAATPTTWDVNFQVNEIKNVSNGETIHSLTENVNGHTVTVDVGRFTVTKWSSIPSNQTIMEGTAANALYFNLRASAENQILKAISVSDLNSVTFNTYATKLELMQGTTVLKTLNQADLDAIAAETAASDKYIAKFDGLNKTLTKDTTTPFTVRVTLIQGNLATFGAAVKLGIADLDGSGDLSGEIDVKRSVAQATATTTTSTAVNGNAYKIASTIPTVALSAQVAKNTTLDLGNTSSYDVVITQIKFDVTRNLVGGTTYAQWGNDTLNPATTKFLDSINGSVVGTPVGNAPGAIVVDTTSAGDLLIGTASVDRIIELVDAANSIGDEQYTVTIKEMSFFYRDRTGVDSDSAVVTETYNVAK